jgi:hypothetical protein
MSAWVKGGQAMRFDANDHPAGSAQHAIAQGESIGGTVAPVATPAAPSVEQILDGLPHIKAYNERIENAWRDPEPLTGKERAND